VVIDYRTSDCNVTLEGRVFLLKPFDAHQCCHMSTAIKHPVPDRVKPSFVIFDIRPGTLTLRAERQSARMSKIANDG